MTDEGAKALGAAILLGLMLNGCMIGLGGRGGDVISYTAAKSLGDEIGNGIAEAACIEAEREWRYERCEEAD